jgi:hypothetical protein
MIGVGEGTGGGMMKHRCPVRPSGWLAYVLVDDVAAATAKAKSLGATVMREVMEVPNAGSFSIITDPTGNAGLWQRRQSDADAGSLVCPKPGAGRVSCYWRGPIRMSKQSPTTTLPKAMSCCVPKQKSTRPASLRR